MKFPLTQAKLNSACNDPNYNGVLSLSVEEELDDSKTGKDQWFYITYLTPGSFPMPTIIT